MPPEIRDVDGVAGLELSDIGVVHRLAETREAIELGLVERDHADRHVGGRHVHRARVEIGGLLGREEGEPPPPRDHAGEIVGDVEMRRDRRPIPDPHARRRPFRHEAVRVRLLEPWKALRSRDRLRRDRERPVGRPLPEEAVEDIVQRRGRTLEVHPLRVRPVEESPALGRRRGDHRHRPAVVEVLQILDRALVRPKRRANRRPLPKRCAKHDRKAAVDDFVGQQLQPRGRDLLGSMSLVEQDRHTLPEWAVKRNGGSYGGDGGIRTLGTGIPRTAV